MIFAFDLKWPNTGRKIPEGARLEIRHIHPNWQDLCYHRLDKRGNEEWVYVSTLPIDTKPNG
jgi:hypothetical protein